MMSTTLVADSGSTKTSWALGPHTFTTQGINPFHMDDAAIAATLTRELLPQVGALRVERVVFYGSGVRPELRPRMEALLRAAFPKAASVEADSDLVGAAHALCGTDEGLACILGTGANSGLFDGRRIVANTPPLGYILGDEGSGAVLGRRFLNALYRNELYAEAQEEFERHFQLTMADVVARVYRQPMANRWLASLAPYVHSLLERPAVRALVVDNFRQFIRHQLAPYGRPDLAIGAVGSIAFYFRDELDEAARHEGYVLGRVLRSPIDALRG